MQHSICYLSKANPLSESELESLFKYIKHINPILDITGVLLYNNNFFLQVLEGDKETITQLFSKIRKDKRHKQILMIFDQKIEIRIFQKYDVKFGIMRTKADIERLNTYLSYYEFEDKYPTNIKTLIEPFLL